jgi:hypothetical protein
MQSDAIKDTSCFQIRKRSNAPTAEPFVNSKNSIPQRSLKDMLWQSTASNYHVNRIRHFVIYKRIKRTSRMLNFVQENDHIYLNM